MTARARACSGPSLTSSISVHSRVTRRPCPARNRRRVEQFVDRVSAIEGHELLAEMVICGVKAQGEVHRPRFGGQAVDPRCHADSGHCDGARRHSHHLDHPPDGFAYVVVVGERFTHAHEDDVADPRGQPGMGWARRWALA